MSLIQEALKRQQEEEKKSKKAEESRQPVESAPQPAEEEAVPEILPGISAKPVSTTTAKVESSKLSLRHSADVHTAPLAPQAPQAPPPPPPELEVKSPPPPPPPPSAPKQEDVGSEGAMSKRVPSIFLKSETKKKSSVPLLIGILIIIAIVGAGGFYYIKNKSAGKSPSKTTENNGVTNVDPVESQPLENPPAETQPENQAKDPGNQTAISPERTSAADSKPVSVDVKPALPEPKPRVMWPSLTLSGVMGKGQKGSAIINNEFLSIGDTIEGVKVISVEEKGVKLSYQGEVQSLKVGNTTM